MSTPRSSLSWFALLLLLCLGGRIALAVSTDSKDSFDENYTVQAYPCNPSTHQREEPHPHIHQKGNIPLTVCIEVPEADRIVIEGIDSFAWTKEEPQNVLVQVAIEHASPTESTVCDCPPGALVCSFQSTLLRSYYDSTGEIVGEGMLLLGQNGEQRQGHRVLRKAGFGVSFIVDEAADSDRPPLKTAGGRGTNDASSILLFILGVFGSSIVLGGI